MSLKRISAVSALLLLVFGGDSVRAASLRADAVLLVNSTSDRYADAQHFVRPYLDNFGVPYTVLDIATTQVGPGIGDYALIIVGHSGLDRDNVLLDAGEQANIVAAVQNGTGLVNFDNDLSRDGTNGRYGFVDSIFGFGYVAPPTGADVTFPAAAPAHYVAALHAASETITTGDMTLAGISLPARVTSLADVVSAGQALLAVTQYGLGRAAQWGSYDWASASVRGPVDGLDDMVWRSLVWTARKPFVMQGLPHFLAMRVDDVRGGFGWLQTANDFGYKPWVGLFYRDIADADAATLSTLVNAGKATASIHARSYAPSAGDFFYFDHYRLTDLAQGTVANYFNEATAWHSSHNIPISKFVVPHFYEFGTNVFAGLQAWGVEFVGVPMAPGGGYYASNWLQERPYRLYETGLASDTNPVWYADYLSIPGHPEYANTFFNCVTEIRDDAGYEWFPDGDVAGTVGRGTRQCQRAFDSMALATLFTHEYYIQAIDPNAWRAILTGVATNLASYNPRYVTMDYACQYVRATRTSDISTSAYDTTTQRLSTSLTGAADIPTQFYVFSDDGAGINETLVDAPAFVGSTQVVYQYGVLDHIGVTPASTATPTGGVVQFHAQGYDATAAPIPGLTYTWSAAAGGTIDQQGLFTAGGTPGVYSATVTASIPPVAGHASVEVYTPILDHFVFDTISNTLYAQIPFPVRVTAYDQRGAVMTSYAGTASLTDTTGTLTPAVTGTFTAGVWSGNVSIATAAATAAITATDGAASGTSGGFTVLPPYGPLDHILVTPASGLAPTGGTVQFSAQGYDANNRPLPRLTYAWATSGGGTINAQGLFTVDGTPGLYTDAVTATVGAVTAHATIQVYGPLIDHFAIDPIAATIHAGTSFAVRITAYDQDGNVFASYAGSPLLTDSTGTISPTRASGFSAGVWSGGVTVGLSATGISITVADQAATGTSNAFDVLPPAGPIRYTVNCWEDNHQDPVLATTTDPNQLIATDGLWTEFWYAADRPYPAVFAAAGEKNYGLPTMRFYTSGLQTGIYDLRALLYTQAAGRDMRYFFGDRQDAPEAYYVDTVGGTGGAEQFTEYSLGTTTITDGNFNLYVRDAALLGAGYPFFGWATIRLIKIDDATCDGIDDDGDGSVDEDYVPYATRCGVGACRASGMSSCVGGHEQTNCTPGLPTGVSEAICNGIDDNCDGSIDEGYVPHATTCGVGACASTGLTSCVGGVVQDSCRPGAPAANDATCNGIDDNCDGSIDEGYVPQPTTCGVGACLAHGMKTCVGGVEQDSCTPGPPTGVSEAICNGIDDDCDGSIDEDYVPAPTTCGVGACASTGVTSCVGGVEQDSCQPGTPAANDATCNGIDDDCDGSVDEDYVPHATTCGVGACASTGVTSCVRGVEQDSCQPGTPAANDATCDGIDDDCDGSIDEDYVPHPTNCGVGGCASTGVTSCVGGVVQDSCQPGTPAANDATCDGIDDDCDGSIDEDYVPHPTTCGVGACASAGVTSCVGGVVQDSCQPGTPAANDATCDGIDDDCDGSIDEDYVPHPTSCGVGACAAAGATSCVNGAEHDSCTPRTPAVNDATCNGIDDDCDGSIDEDYVPHPTSCGVGACAAAGATSCVNGAEHDSCTPGTPAANDATCNGIDDDCDGSIDEDYVPHPTTCGVGACAAAGTTSCVNGAEHDSCTPGTPAANDATCNGIDDDCDGSIDEDYVPHPTTCGVGACASTGVTSCVGGVVQDSCQPGTPAANDATCDGIDDDCDGSIDEDYVPHPTSCGVGACAAAGATSCVNGAEHDSCMPGTPAANDATCNGIDDDCDGSIDEDYVPHATSCGVGACAAAGATSCVNGVEHDSCTPGTPAANDATCNGIDDDCDGSVDEDYVPHATNCGVGACASTGVTSCVGGVVQDSCQPGTPAADDATCDGIDDDCDGSIDEDYVPHATNCGVGACASTGVTSCVGGVEHDSCTPGTPAANDATCNGIDDDCNGSVDEDYVPQPTSCGVGACWRTGATACVSGQVVDRCVAGTPAANDATCDGIDDDCDGSVDEDYGSQPSSCGVGACVATGTKTCANGVVHDSCVAGTPAPDDATCNGIDDNCDGTVDEQSPVCPGSPTRRIDFGSPGAALAAGYERDSGAAFDATAQYGWISGTLQSRARSCSSADPRQQTLVYTKDPQIWEIAVKNGDYDVTVSVGDCSYAQGPQQVVVEGGTVVSGETTAANQFLVRTQRVQVRDGRLTVTIGGTSGYTTLNYIDIAPSANQPATLLSINFQTTDARTPLGFLPDSGAVYDSRGRGWSRVMTGFARSRGRNADLALDSFIYAGSTSATYEVALPAGVYDVTLAIGDASNAQGPQRVVVEGLTAFDGSTTAVNQFLKKTLRVPVDDGRLTVVIGGRPENTNTPLNFLTIASPPSAAEWHVNFQPAGSDVPPGYTADSGAVYSDARGYGWTASQGTRTRDRNVETDQRIDTLLYVGQPAQVWEAATPSGDYEVTVSVGDAAYAQGPQYVQVEGIPLFAGEKTAARQFLRRTVRVPVRDGKLTLAVGGGATGYTTINYVDIVPLPALWAVNFQPEAAPVPSGFVADAGRIYTSARGYGWQDDYLFTAGRSRDRNLLDDQSLDTFIFESTPAAFWSLDAPNGDYLVTVSVGDAAYAQGPHRVIVEGATLVNNETTLKGQFLQRSTCVTVTDGKLEMEMGGAPSGFTALNYLKVASNNCSRSLGIPGAVVTPAPARDPASSGDRSPLR